MDFSLSEERKMLQEMADPTASTRNDPFLSLRLTDASPLGNVSA